MAEELITNLPPEIIIDILSRLPIRTVTTSKCVCKPRLDLIETPEFAKSHLSKSVPGLVVYKWGISLDLLKIFEFEDVAEHQEELHYNRITEIYQGEFFKHFQSNVGIGGSANGLLFLRDFSVKPNDLYISNPITRESTRLQSLERIIQYPIPTYVTYGFGVTRISCEYKVVGIHYDRKCDPRKSECWIYTLGTATWRSIPTIDTFEYSSCYPDGVLLNGNLHWLVVDLKGSCLISCLNLETEIFSRFTTPPVPERSRFLRRIVVLVDCLCLCDNITYDDEIVIWVMKEYGVNKSWKKEYVISKSPYHDGDSLYPFKVFKDGDILMWGLHFHLFYYSNKTKTTTKLDMFQLGIRGHIQAILHTPSFVSLKDFVLENVTSFRFLFSLGMLDSVSVLSFMMHGTLCKSFLYWRM